MFEIVRLGFEQCGGVVVDGDGGDFVAHAVVFAAALAGVVFAHDFSGDVETVRNLAEYRVAVVEEWGGSGGDEELRAVGARAGVGHGKHSGRAMAQIGVEFIGEFVSRAAASCFSGITALQHKAHDDAEEGHAIVVSTSCEIQEIRTSEWCFGGVECGGDVSRRGVNGDFNIGHSRRQHAWVGGGNHTIVNL